MNIFPNLKLNDKNRDNIINKVSIKIKNANFWPLDKFTREKRMFLAIFNMHRYTTNLMRNTLF